ncbi:MAG: hypothetical protein FWD28_00660 [Treponema sp.]|nr:hypothetical protein [Treponema sp.]
MKELFCSAITSDKMIIQRDVYFPLYLRKYAEILFLGKNYKAKKTGGKWLIKLDPVKAGGPFDMQITFGSESVTLTDIYAGDLFLCSGQSNMEMLMDRVKDNFSEEWENSDFPLVRHFHVPQEWDFSAPRDELNGGHWTPVTSRTLNEFSAAAYFFAKNLYQRTKVPIGLINTAWGGTPIESWMSKDALSSFKEKLKTGMQYADKNYSDNLAKNTENAIREWETNLRHEDIGLAQNWQNPQTDISGWEEVELPGNFKSGFCGVIWAAKDFEVSADFASQKIEIWLGTIIDADTAYLNGEEIGNTGYRYPPRKYSPKDLLKQGKNRLVIRITCNNGDGGVTSDKPFRIFSDKEAIELTGTWKYKIGAPAQTRPAEFFFQRQPFGNFNAIISPVLKFPLKGVLWYQGESNESTPYEYEQLLKLMINDWRKKNNNKKLPFFIVQLPIFNAISDNNEKSRWAVLREAQRKAVSLPYTGLACALELGEWNDIHPMNKKDVGYRLFLAAEKVLLGIDNSSPGPVINKYEIQKNKILIHFNNCGEKLTAYSSPQRDEISNNAFVSVVGSDGQVRLPVKIESKDCISIDISSVKNAQRILYAWADNPQDRQLFNSKGLPALPFILNLRDKKYV